MRLYNCSVGELLVGSVSSIVRSLVFNSFDANGRYFASFSSELKVFRSNRLLPGLVSDDSVSHDELLCIIDCVCTNQFQHVRLIFFCLYVHSLWLFGLHVLD